MFLSVARESSIAVTAFIRSPFTRTRSPVSMAMSVPVPIAIPTSALAIAGLSLIPSPAIATKYPCFCRPVIIFAFWSGVILLWTSSIPASLAIALATFSLSPVIITVLILRLCRSSMAFLELSLMSSRTP